jgi:hypothetical protein
MLERTNIQWVSLALVITAVACSGGVDDSTGSMSTAASGSASAAASGSGGAGGGGIGSARAAAVSYTNLNCDGGAGPGGDLTDLRLIIDEDPFVCESPCQTVYYGDIDVDCEDDWRLHVRVPATPGVYDVGATASVWLISGVDPMNPAACASHSAASGTVEITSVSDVEVVGTVSNVSIGDVPGVDPNGPFTAPRCD